MDPVNVTQGRHLTDQCGYMTSADNPVFAELYLALLKYCKDFDSPLY